MGESGDGNISVLAEMRQKTISELFPSLGNCAAELIESPHLDRRAHTSLARQGCRTWGDLQALTVDELWSIPHAGKLTVERILAAAQHQAALLAGRGASNASTNGLIGLPAPVTPSSPGQVATERFIGVLVEWAQDSRNAASVQDYLEALNGPLPPDVAAAFEALRSLSLVDVIPRLIDEDTRSRLIAEFLSDLGSDGRLVMARHIANPSGRIPTLESIAKTEGLTRERIRQLIKRGLDTAKAVGRREPYRLLSWRASDLRSALGVVCRAEAPGAQAAIERAARGFVDPDGCTAAEFMLWFSGPYRRKGDWWIAAEVDGVDDARKALQNALNHDWLLHRNEMLGHFNAQGIVADLSDTDIAQLSQWRAIGDDWWVRWDGAIGDKAERILRLMMRAVSLSEMNELIGEGHAVSSVHNGLYADDRFMRVSMDLEYALSEWEWEEYSTAAQEIVERIERAGGEAVLDDVVIELFNQFGLKEATVRAYASSPAFVVADGIIRLRRSNEEVVVNDRVSSVQGVYLRPDGCVVFHLPVDADVLRGSGKSIPNPLSVAVGVRPGEVRDFDAGEWGRLRMTWPATSITGAAIGSTRSIVEGLGANAGDVVRLVIDMDAETVESVVVAGASLSELTGLTLTPGGEAAELAAAIQVDPIEVRAALAERGDETVASMIPRARPSSGLDDALLRLSGMLD